MDGGIDSQIFRLKLDYVAEWMVWCSGRTDIQFKEKAAIKGIDKYVKLFVIWLSIDRLLPNCKLSMKTSTKNILINDLLGLKH